jgi:hypothetical protein
MNSHLKNFYPDDSLNDSANKSGSNNNNNDSINNNSSAVSTNQFSTPQHTNDSSEYDKKIYLLNKKLRTYEKRRQKLLYESKKEQEQTNSSVTTAGTAFSDQLADKQSDMSDNKLASSSAASLINSVPNSSATGAQITPVSYSTLQTMSTQHQQQQPQHQQQSKLLSSNRNGSFMYNSNLLTKSDEFSQMKPVAAVASSTISSVNQSAVAASAAAASAIGDEKLTSFYLNQETIGSNVKFPNLINNGNETNDLLNEDSNATANQQVGALLLLFLYFHRSF